MEIKKVYVAMVYLVVLEIIYTATLLMMFSSLEFTPIKIAGYVVALIMGCACIASSYVLMGRLIKKEGIWKLGYFITAAILNQIPFFPPVALAAYYVRDVYFPKTPKAKQ